MTWVSWTPEENAFLLECRMAGMSLRKITSAHNERFGTNRTFDAIASRAQTQPTIAELRSRNAQTARPTTEPARSLATFAATRRQNGDPHCVVCGLSPDVRQQIDATQEKRADIIAWLREDIGIDVSEVELSRHQLGKHGQAA